MEELFKSDNAAIVVLVAWVAFLIKDRAVMKAERDAMWELYKAKDESMDKVVDGLRRIRHVLQMEHTGEWRREDFPDR